MNKKIIDFKKKILFINLFFFFYVLILLNQSCFADKDKQENSNYKNNVSIILNKANERSCYSFFEEESQKIIHFIITRFMTIFFNSNGFPKKMNEKDYILNGIRVMKKYLLPSLENQACTNFTWILLVGDEVNEAKINNFFSNSNYSFKFKIIQQKKFKNYLKNTVKGFDVLVTTRIDYDDRIYYDAVNDVRKIININKPILLHGYNRGAIYNELDGKYYDYYVVFKNNMGIWSVFASLAIFLNSTNDIYTIYDIGDHGKIRKNLIEKYMLYGIKNLSYDPAVLDSGSRKFVWVRQKYSGTYTKNYSFEKKFKEINFNLRKFYGK